LDSTQDSYFAPLKDLDVGRSELYFGAIHSMQNIENFKKRVGEIQKYCSDFGLAAPCGLGRHQPEEVPGVLRDHRKAVEILHSL
ncbi:MAG: hypothetical protein ACREP6_06730, partial [Candidatus Binataceae bacterium]